MGCQGHDFSLYYDTNRRYKENCELDEHNSKACCFKGVQVSMIELKLPTEVIGVHEVIDFHEARVSLNDYLLRIENNINLKDLDDWRLTVSIISQNKDRIGVGKRIVRYPSSKEVEIGIGMPIPDVTQAAYGAFDRPKDSFFKKVDEKWSSALEPEFVKFANLNEYFVGSGIRALEFLFTRGFTFQGKKIRFVD